MRIDGPDGQPLNTYGPAVARKRAEHLGVSTVSVFNMYADLRPSRARPPLTLALIGDFITGAIHEENAVNAAMPPEDAADFAYKLLRDTCDYVIRWAAPSSAQFVLRVGNHGRTTKKNHAVAKRGFNHETTIYRRLRDYFGDEHRGCPLSWYDPPEQGGYGYAPLSFGRVGRYMHGEEIEYRGGVGGLYAPLATRVARWNTEPGAQNALSFFGHHHTFCAADMALGNGSLIGHSALGRGFSAPFEPPCQAMAVVSPYNTRGFLATHRLMVESAPG